MGMGTSINSTQHIYVFCSSRIIYRKNRGLLPEIQAKNHLYWTSLGGIIPILFYYRGDPMKLLVRNLSRTTTEDELRKMFEVLGKVQSCSLVIDKETGVSKGFAFIEMPRPGDAKAAVKTLNAKNLAGNIIRVKKAVSKKATADKLAAKELEAGKTEPEKVEPEKVEPEKLKTEKAVEKKKTNVNRNIWSK